MTELTPDDLHHVVSRTPKDVLSLMKARNLVLAGGCIRAIVAGEKVSDFDLFGPSKAVLELAAKDLCIARKGRLYATDNAFTVLSPDRAPVQFIFRWTYEQAQDVINDFDFSVAQAGIWFKMREETLNDEHPTGNWCSLCSELFYPDLASKRLRYLAPDRNEDAGGSVLRARKFLQRGYHIEAGSFGRVIARLCMGVEHVASAMNGPNCPPEMRGEAWLAQLLTAKLREVDPLTVIEGLELVDEHQVKDITPVAPPA